MKLSVFTDEIAMDIAEGLPHFREWGLEWVDLRCGIMGKEFHALTRLELSKLAKLLKKYGMRVGCLQSSLAKVHLPDDERLKAEQKKLDGIIRAADALDCRLVRAFFYWQPQGEEKGCLSVRPDMFQQVLDRIGPLVSRARSAGLTLAYENCGVTIPECLAVLDALKIPEWGLAWDCANEFLAGDCSLDDKRIAEYAARTRCVHVKAHGAVPGLVDFAVPWEKILLALASCGFNGPVSVETHNPEMTVSHLEMSKRVFDSMRRAWPGGAAVKAKSKFGFEPVGFVIVGLGMGAVRARELQRQSGAKVVGLVDKNARRAEEVGKELGVEWTTELNPWLDRAEAEAVFVETPTGCHADVAVAALEAGKHVIVTKPMEANLAACDRMIRAAMKAGRLLAVDFACRLDAHTQRMKQEVEAGRLGRILGGTMSLRVLRNMDYFRSSGGWRGTKSLDGGGVMSNQNIHHIDELIYILGMPRRVCMLKWTQTHEIEAEDLGCATWEYDNGAVVQIYATTSYPQETWHREIHLHGTAGAVLHLSGGPYSAPIERWFIEGRWQTALPAVKMLPWESLGQNLAAALRTGAPLVCDGKDGRRSRHVLDKMYASAGKKGAWIEV